MLKLRDALEQLDRNALVTLMRLRGLPAARDNNDRCTALARSYRGDATALFNDLRKDDLIRVLRFEWTLDGDVYELKRPSSYSRDDLARIAVDLFATPDMPKEFERVRAQEVVGTDAEPSKVPPHLRPVKVTALLDAALPSWLVRLDTPLSSRDPLGLQAAAGRHAEKILPGLNVFTSRARYYSFLCWAIAGSQRSAPAAAHLERVHRLERLLVLSESLAHRDQPKACSFVGRRRGTAFVRENASESLWALPTRILKNQTSNGALRLYRTSLEDLGLIEEEELEGGLGLRLTGQGERLAERYGTNLDENMVAWAINGAEQRRRADTVLGFADKACLSAAIGKRERSILSECLLGAAINDGTQSALRRRETTRLLFARGLLEAVETREDIASEDADAVTEDGGAATAQAESLGNWAFVRELAETMPSSELQDLQAASAFELLGLALNQMFSSLLDALADRGRMPLGEWVSGVGAEMGPRFQATASTGMGRRGVISYADACLDPELSSWAAEGARAFDLLAAVLRSQRLVTWLAAALDEQGFVDSILDRRGDLDRVTPAAFLGDVVRALVVHHREVSVRKGKSEWVALEGDALVRMDRQRMRPLIHSLRFAQLQQIASDLRLTPEVVSDAS